MANKQNKASSVEESSEFVARCSEQVNVALMFSIREPCFVRHDSSGERKRTCPHCLSRLGGADWRHSFKEKPHSQLVIKPRSFIS